MNTYLVAVHSQQPVGVSHANGYSYNDVAESRNLKRNDGFESVLISGLCCSYSLWVGIQILIVRHLKGMEHLNYACHP